MNTIKIFLAGSGRIADVRKDFPLYQGQFNDKLLNVYVPTSILAPSFELQSYIGQMSGAVTPTDETLTQFVADNTPDERSPRTGDTIEFYNTSTEKYYLYVASVSVVGETTTVTWNSTEVDGFGTFTQLAGTSVKIGLLATSQSGVTYKSKSYFMRFLKTLTYENVEYALYERKLPKEFTAFEGQGANAPTMVINVVNVNNTNDTVLSYITSQTCALDVMRSTLLDTDEAIEASDLERLTAELNSALAEIALKQNKADSALTTGNKTVVGGINELKTQADENTENVGTLQQEVSDMQAFLSTSRTYIGTYETTLSAGDTLNAALSAYVEEQVERAPRNGDTVIVIQIISGATDKNFEYFYGASGWQYYEIPPMEMAQYNSLGLVKGTYSGAVAGTNFQIGIVNGEIVDILIKDSEGTTYYSIRGLINNATASIASIISGTTQVGNALKATQDGAGNNIVNTYMTNMKLIIRY